MTSPGAASQILRPAVREPSDCPNAAAHQPHPTGYSAHSWWAECATPRIASQSVCPGCGRWEIWTPKQPGLRIARTWPPPLECQWVGPCVEEAAVERWSEERGEWVAVCGGHIDIKESR
jgi:hypothetical protein